jgi:hypothetical protein
MTRTDTDPHADQQDPMTWTEEDDDAPWEGPLLLSAYLSGHGSTINGDALS